MVRKEGMQSIWVSKEKVLELRALKIVSRETDDEVLGRILEKIKGEKL